MMTLKTLTRVALPKIGNPLKWVVQANRVHRSRRHLSRLSDEALNDIGLTRAQATEEAAKPVWDAPIGWKG